MFYVSGNEKITAKFILEAKKLAANKTRAPLCASVTMSNIPNSSGSVLGKAAEVTVHSGNVASWNKLRKKGGLTSTDEVGAGACSRNKTHRLHT